MFVDNNNNKLFFLALTLRFCLSATKTAAVERTSSNHKHLGCYLGENLLSLGDESRVFTAASPQSCSEHCNEKRHAFFILKNDTCYCNKNYVSSLMRESDSECTTKCAGDDSASCGGPPNFVSSYATTAAANVTESIRATRNGSYPIPIYLGCYIETPGDDENRLLKGPAQPYIDNTPQSCSEICFNMGYLYFGVTYRSECWCGNQQPSKSVRVGEINCDSPCSGDPKQLCGGGWKMGIYSTGITDHVPTDYVGCFEGKGNVVNGTTLSYQLGNNNNPRRCTNLCGTQRFKYAAIRGDTCECKNDEPDMNSARSFNDCNFVCKGNPYEYCGGLGGNTLQNVYKTTPSDTPGEVSVRHVGCYKNSKRHPVLNGWKLTISRLTSKQCAYSCHARMFPYAALISSKECLCSFVKPHNDALTRDEMCTTLCSGSSERSCGDHKTVNVYSTGLKPKRVAIGNYYLGCFEERPQNRLYNSYSKSFLTNTPEFCSNLCYTFGYTHSGVTYKSECFCGSQTPTERHFPMVDDKYCNTKCTGDANQYCGGGWRIGVFATGLYDFQIDNQYVGCFVLHDNTLKNKKFEFIYTNTPSKCSAVCYDYGYQYANVIGLNCYCSDDVPNDDQKVIDADCDTICVGNSNETCGGDDRIQIYNLKIPNNRVNTSILSHDTSDQLANTTDPIYVEEKFDSLNLKSLWSHDLYIAQEPDFEFVVYNNSEQNSFVKNGELVLKPTIQSDDEFIKKGSLIINGCTENAESFKCAMNASSFHIIPPVVSARLSTKNNLLFRYGKLEVIAKFPIGDWIVSEIALISESNEQNKLVLASSFGNNNLKCNGEDESATVLRYGLKIDEKLYNAKSKIMKSILTKRWSDDYHSFGLSWKPENIEFEIDGKSKFLNASNISQNFKFDSKYYITVGVSVGGMTNFRDDCLSNGTLKPWKNYDNKALLHFWKDKTNWSSTWNDETSALRIKSVKLTTKEGKMK